MSVIPEVVLQKAIVAGFRSIRKDSRLLDAIFRNLNQTQLQSVKDFVLKTPIDFSINYPRKEPSLPSLILLLKSEQEGSAFLNDVMGDSSNFLTPDPELTYDTLGGNGASTSGSSGLPVKVAGPLKVASQPDSNTITFQDGEDITHLEKNLLAIPTGCLKLYIVGGSGVGEVYDIFDLDEGGVDIIGSFTTTLDSTTVVDIRKADDPEAATGEPSRVYAHDGNYYRKGVNYQVQYNINVLTGHQDETIYLYSTLKALLLSQRTFLESQGIINLKISGTDFAPRTEFLPDEVFQRVMTLSFESPFSFIEELETFNNINVNYWVEDDIIASQAITL